jgi:hypothetical protein
MLGCGCRFRRIPGLNIAATLLREWASPSANVCVSSAKHNAKTMRTQLLMDVPSNVLHHCSPRRSSSSEPINPHEFHASPLTTFLNRSLAPDLF